MGIYGGLGVPGGGIGAMMRDQPGQGHKWRPQPLELSLLCPAPGKGAMRVALGAVARHLGSPALLTSPPPPPKQPLGPRSFSGPRLGKMGVEGNACVDLDSRLRAAWAGNSDILWSRKEIVPVFPLVSWSPHSWEGGSS